MNRNFFSFPPCLGSQDTAVARSNLSSISLCLSLTHPLFPRSQWTPSYILCGEKEVPVVNFPRMRSYTDPIISWCAGSNRPTYRTTGNNTLVNMNLPTSLFVIKSSNATIRATLVLHMPTHLNHLNVLHLVLLLYDDTQKIPFLCFSCQGTALLLLPLEISW